MNKIDKYTFIELKDDEYVPNKYEPGIVYVTRAYKGAAFICPCGCETKIFIPVDEKHEPGNYWQLKKNDNSIEPSILQLNGCKSHFFIRKGLVEWS